MNRSHDAPFLRSRPHLLASFTTWRALRHGLEIAPPSRPKRTILWRDVVEVRLAEERDRSGRRRRCDLVTRANERFTIYGPVSSFTARAVDGGDYGALVREVIARARKANPSCRFVNGRFLGGVAIFHVLVFAVFVAFVEAMGRFSGMKAEDPTGFAWMQYGAVAVLALWSTLVVYQSAPRPLDPDAIPARLLAE